MILDLQIQFHREQSLEQLAMWLVKKWGKACAKRCEMLESREKLQTDHGPGLTDEELREEYRKQVEAQTKPLPRERSSKI